MVQGRQKRGGEDKDTSFVVHEVIEESNQCQSQMKFDTQLLDVWTKWIVPENCMIEEDSELIIISNVSIEKEKLVM